MCDPVSASIGLMAAGTAAQAAGAHRSQKAMSGAREAERIRQKGYQDESTAAYEASKANADKGQQDTQQGKLEAERKDAYANATEAAQAPVAAVGSNLAGDTAGNAVVGDELARQSAGAAAYANQQGNAKAAMQGFSDLQLNNNLFNSRQIQKQNMLGNFMRGSADVLPIEMEAASHKGDGLNALGSVLQLAGTVAGVGAGAGWWGAGNEAAKGAAEQAAGYGLGGHVGKSGFFMPSLQKTPMSPYALFQLR